MITYSGIYCPPEKQAITELTGPAEENLANAYHRKKWKYEDLIQEGHSEDSQNSTKLYTPSGKKHQTIWMLGIGSSTIIPPIKQTKEEV